MEDLVKQVRIVARGMWRFRWQGLVIAWAVAAVGVIVVFKIPDRYEATARIYVDTQSILKPLMAGLTVQPNVEQQIGMLSRTLISRPNVEKLVRMADLDLKNDSKADQEALIEKLMKTIEIRDTARDNLYSLAFRDADQDKAKRVIQSLVSIFVESSLGASRKDTDSAKTFLNEQIKSYEAKLEEAEQRVKQFRLRNLEMQSADGKDATARLAEVSAHLEQAKLELREAENARDAARKQLADEKSNGNIMSTTALMQESATSASTPEIDSRIEAQKRNLDQLLQRYTDQHPDIVYTRKMIKELEEQKKHEIAEQKKAAAAHKPGAGSQQGMNAASSLAYQELSRIVATAEVQVASLKARVSEYQGRYGAVKASLANAPQLEAEAAQLNRDYAITKKNYEDLVARRQAAVMSGELDVASGVAEFRLIDPPRVSPRPVAPNRLLLLPVTLLAALGAGLLTAFVASQLRPVFNEAAELRAGTGLPLLGVISLALGDDQRRRERMSLMRFVGASGSLVFLFAAGLIAMSILSGRS
jgi:polysaccharide chain length determinant protein (PEP-CTERM system associated)